MEAKTHIGPWGGQVAILPYNIEGNMANWPPEPGVLAWKIET
jgi:hypothetical protein